MAFPPIQYFRKEDFPEIAGEAWAQRIFTKLNELARQAQYGIDNNLTVTENLSAFWWEGNIGAITKVPELVYPYAYAAGIPTVTNKRSVSIQGFPFYITNKISPRNVKGIFVAQAFDVTKQDVTIPVPALVGNVAWLQEADKLKIYGIDGMVTGTNADKTPARCYFTRLLILGE